MSTETTRLIRDGKKGCVCVCGGVGGWEERGLEYHNIIQEVGGELFNWKVVVVVQINPCCTKGSYFAMSNCVLVLINLIASERIVIYKHFFFFLFLNIFFLVELENDICLKVL